MKKFTLTLVAALIAVVSFAQISATKQVMRPVEQMSLEPKTAVKLSFDNIKLPVPAFKGVLGKKAPRRIAISSIDELQGEVIIANENFDFDDEGKLTKDIPERSGLSASIEVTGTNTIKIYGLSEWSDEGVGVEATVNLSEGTFTIANGQKVGTNETYGDITIQNASESGAPLTGTIYEGNVFVIDQYWNESVVYQEQNARWSSIYSSQIVPANGVMDIAAGTADETSKNVYIEQDESTKVVTIWNFGSHYYPHGVVKFDVASDKTFSAAGGEQVVGYHSQLGSIYIWGSASAGSVDDISGTMTTETMTANIGLGYLGAKMSGWVKPAHTWTVTRTDGIEFTFPAQEIGELVTPPDGISTTDWPISANSFYVNNVNTGSYNGTVKLGIVGTDVYIQGMDSYLPDAWVKGTYDAEAKTVTIPVTYMGIHENVTHYMGGYSSDGPKDIVLTYDEEDNTYSTSGSVMIYKGSATTAYVAFYNGLLIGTPPTPVTAPDGLITEDMPFKGKLNGATTETEGTVKVGFVDNDVYIQGLFNDVVAAGWIKGTISDGKATFPVNQYIGNRSNGTRVYLVGYANSTVGDVVFNYDATNKVFTSTNMVLASGAKNSLSPYSFYSAGLTIGTQPDGINAINADVKSADEGAWYTVNGVRVAAPTQKGLYIHNGKKVVIK